MRLPISLIFPILLSVLSFKTAAKECDCSLILSQSIQKVEENYALFKIKVNAHTQPGYQAFNQLYLQKAKTISESLACQKLLNDWVAYFNDKHLWITVKTEDKKISYIQHRLQLRSYRARWKDPLWAQVLVTKKHAKARLVHYTDNSFIS